MSSEPVSHVYEQGLTLAEQGRHEEAITCIKEHLRMQPRDFQAFNDIGVILFCMGRTAEAIEHFEKARELCAGRDSTELNWNLCEAYLSNGQPGFAVRLFDEMGRQHIMNADLLNRTSEAFLREGAFGNAIEYLLRSLELAPSQDILKPMIDVIKSKRPKVAFFTNRKSELSQGLSEFMANRFIAEVFEDNTTDDTQSIMTWCDIAMFDGYSEVPMDISDAEGSYKTVLILGDDDMENNAPESICWDNLDTVIFTGSCRGRDLLFEAVSDIEKRTKVVFMRRGVDTERFRFTDKQKGKRIACLEELCLKNNPMLLLQCMQKLHFIDNDYRLYFSKDFEDAATEEYLRYMTDQLGLTNVVFFDGGIGNEASWLADKHYITAASITGSGIEGVLKGMSCGLKPVVANFPRSSEMLDMEFVFDLAEDFCRQVLSEDYQPRRYRQIVEARHSRGSQMTAINDVLFRLEKEIAMRPDGEAELVGDHDSGQYSPELAVPHPVETGEAQDISLPMPEPSATTATIKIPSKVIPIKPVETETLQMQAEAFASNASGGAPLRSGASINEMSADVLRDWRAFTERISGNCDDASSGGVNDNFGSAPEMSPAGVTPLDLPAGTGTGRIMEVPAQGPHGSLSVEKVEANRFPFM